MIEAYFDGCCEPINPGGTASYGAIVLVNGMKVWDDSALVPAPTGGKTSNNVAEYSGFIAVAEYLLGKRIIETYSSHADRIIIRGDSMLVIRQLHGLWKVRGGHYIPFYRRAMGAWKLLKLRYPGIELEWIPRDKNGLADELSKCLLKKAGIKFRLQPE